MTGSIVTNGVRVRASTVACQRGETHKVSWAATPSAYLRTLRPSSPSLEQPATNFSAPAGIFRRTPPRRGGQGSRSEPKALSLTAVGAGDRDLRAGRRRFPHTLTSS